MKLDVKSRWNILNNTKHFSARNIFKTGFCREFHFKCQAPFPVGNRKRGERKKFWGLGKCEFYVWKHIFSPHHSHSQLPTLLAAGREGSSKAHNVLCPLIIKLNLAALFDCQAVWKRFHAMWMCRSLIWCWIGSKVEHCQGSAGNLKVRKVLSTKSCWIMPN